MGLVTTRSVVLQTYRYSDTSKILRLMTREHGPRSAIAKGALRPKSRFGGVLEPFAEGDATLYVKEGRDLHTLSGFDLVRERQALGADLVRFTGASVLCELVMRLAPEHRDDRLYRTLVSGLDELVAAAPDAAARTALRRVWRTVAVLGFAPDLSRCLECGREIGAGEAGRFDHAAGGLRCARCSPHGRRLSPDALALLRALAGPRRRGNGDGAGPAPGGAAGGTGAADAARRPPSGPAPGSDPGPAEREQGRLLADFIRYHLAENTRLRSLDFLTGL